MDSCHDPSVRDSAQKRDENNVSHLYISFRQHHSVLQRGRGISPENLEMLIRGEKKQIGGRQFVKKLFSTETKLLQTENYTWKLPFYALHKIPPLVWCKKNVFSTISISSLPSQERPLAMRENPGKQEQCGLPLTEVQCCWHGLFPEKTLYSEVKWNILYYSSTKQYFGWNRKKLCGSGCQKYHYLLCCCLLISFSILNPDLVILCFLRLAHSVVDLHPGVMETKQEKHNVTMHRL